MSDHSEKDLKKERIIEVALKQFAQNGYKQTSTDIITKEANVSKGILFHHFQTKMGLFQYLYQYSLKLIMQEIQTYPHYQGNDFFDIILSGVEAKWHVMSKSPYIFEFMTSALRDTDQDIKLFINSQHQLASSDVWQDIMSRVDKQKFKSVDDIEKLMSLIRYYNDGLMVHFKELGADVNSVELQGKYAEFKEMMAMLKRNFYKVEYL